jgi:hypothetical protein
MSSNPLEHKSRTLSSVLDRRIEDRPVAEGDALVVPSDFGAEPVEAQLLDVSEQGFRIKYDNAPPLFSGQEVQFLLPKSSGLALVMWTRVLDGEAESGLRILRSLPLEA